MSDVRKKICSCCFKEKLLIEFSKKKNGHQYNCNLCQSDIMRMHRALKAGKKTLEIRVEFTAEEWQQVKLEMSEVAARKIIKDNAKTFLVNKVFGLKDSCGSK